MTIESHDLMVMKLVFVIHEKLHLYMQFRNVTLRVYFQKFAVRPIKIIN